MCDFSVIEGRGKEEGSVVVDLTQSSSDDEDFQKEETVSAHLEDKRVHFRKSGIVKTSGPRSRKTQVQNY